MSYSLATIWYERQRFLPAILAVAFSAILIAVQGGLVIGLLAMMSLPVDKSLAHVWVGYPGVRSVDLGRPIPERWVGRVAAHPNVDRVDPCMIGFSLWTRIDRDRSAATPEVITIVGCRLDPDSLGAVEALRENPELMVKLAEPGSVVVDASEIDRLGVDGAGGQADVLGRRAKVVGVVEGYKSLGGPYVFCSIETARTLLKDPGDGVTYLLARCDDQADAPVVAAQLDGYDRMQAFTAESFSLRSRMHWLFTTKAGIAVGFTALLGLLVGAVVTSQTLYAATAASQREFATMRAMGIPTLRLQLAVLTQSFWVGLFGLIIAGPVSWVIAEVANAMGTAVRLHPMVLLAAAVITMGMSLLSGLVALRSFQGVDPAHNLR